jgi:hypothetical protein
VISRASEEGREEEDRAGPAPVNVSERDEDATGDAPREDPPGSHGPKEMDMGLVTRLSSQLAFFAFA